MARLNKNQTPIIINNIAQMRLAGHRSRLGTYVNNKIRYE